MVECLLPKQKVVGSNPIARSISYPTSGRFQRVRFPQQESRCNDYRSAFPFRNLTVDHIIPESRRGTDHIDYLQLRRGHCNSVKGGRPQEYLVAKLRELGTAL